MKISVDLCCHSPKTDASFVVEVGDTILISKSKGILAELTVLEITLTGLRCKDVDGREINVSADQVKALYIP